MPGYAGTVLFVAAYPGFSLAAALFEEGLRPLVPGVRFRTRHYQRAFTEVDPSFVRDLLLLRPDVVAFSCFFWNLEACLQMARTVRRLSPSCLCVLGGPQVGSPAEAADLLAAHDAVDQVICGEGDEAFPLLVARCLGAVEPEVRIPGLVTRNGTSFDRAEAPAVVRDLTRVPRVFHPGAEGVRRTLHRGPMVPLQTLRGCRNSCSYCLYQQPRLRFFPLDRLESEIAFLCGEGVSDVRVCDSHFGGSRPRAMALFEMIRRHNRATRFHIYPDPRHVDAEYLDAARAARCQPVSLGVETLDPDVAAGVRRRQPRAEFEAAFHHLQECGERIQVDFMFGLPGQGVESVRNDVLELKTREKTDILFSPLMLFPGTALAEESGADTLEVLPLPQRFAFPRQVGVDAYATMYAIKEGHDLLARLPRLDAHLRQTLGAAEYRAVVDDVLCHACDGGRHELVLLSDAFDGDAAYLRSESYAVASSSVRWIRDSSPRVNGTYPALEEVARVDVLEMAVHRRRRELDLRIEPPRPQPRVYLADDLTRRTWLLHAEGWLERHAVPTEIVEFRPLPSSGALTTSTNVLYFPPYARLYALRPEDSALLALFHQPRPVFDAEHPYDTSVLRTFSLWVRRGVLVPATADILDGE